MIILLQNYLAYASTILGILYNFTILVLLNSLWSTAGKLTSTNKFTLELFSYGKNKENIESKQNEKVDPDAANTSRKGHKPRAVSDIFNFFFIKVPKSWFYHFYISSLVMNGSLFYVILNSKSNFAATFIENYSYIMSILTLKFNELIFLSRGFVDSQQQNYKLWKEFMDNIDTNLSWNIKLLFFCICFQASRRLYECLFVSIYSKAKQSLLAYVSSIAYYVLQGNVILVGCFMNFKEKVDSARYMPSNLQITLAVIVFLVASITQFQTHTILANLRKNKPKSSKNQHYIPYGGLFQYISCPHYFSEILIYLSFSLLVGASHIPFNLIVVLTILDQIFCGIVCHKWYVDNFRGKYPKNRKILVPFLF